MSAARHVAILGLLGASAWSIHGTLTARGTPGHRALRVRQATELLVDGGLSARFA